MPRKVRSDKTVGSVEKDLGLSTGAIRNKDGKDTRSDKKLGTIRKEQNKQNKQKVKNPGEPVRITGSPGTLNTGAALNVRALAPFASYPGRKVVGSLSGGKIQMPVVSWPTLGLVMGIVSLLFGVIVMIFPKILNYLVGIYLIIIGVMALVGYWKG